jgi:hypothetical protein
VCINYADAIGAQQAAAARDGATVVDTRNLLEPELVREAGLGYDGVGRR